MKRIFVVGSIVAGSLLAVACVGDPDPPTESVEDTTTVATLPTEPQAPGEFYPVEVDGRRCILWMYQYADGGSTQDSMSGLTCDWSER